MVLLAHLSQSLSLRVVQKAWSHPPQRTFSSILVSLLDSTQKCPNRLSLNTHWPRLFFNWSWQVTGKKNYPVWSWSITIYTAGLRRGWFCLLITWKKSPSIMKSHRKEGIEENKNERGRRRARGEERIKEREWKYLWDK